MSPKMNTSVVSPWKAAKSSWVFAMKMWQLVPVSPDKLAWLPAWCGALLCCCWFLLLWFSFKKISAHTMPTVQPDSGSETIPAQPRTSPVPLSPEASAQAHTWWQRVANVS